MGSRGKAREGDYPHTFGMIVRQPNWLFARYLKGDFTHMNMSAKDIAEWAGESIGERSADKETYNAVHGHGYDWFEIALKWIEETNGKRRANKRRRRQLTQALNCPGTMLSVTLCLTVEINPP